MLVSPASFHALLCNSWFVHLSQQHAIKQQRKQQHLHFWLPDISYCKLSASSHFPSCNLAQ